jgi:hypothetical protein
MPAIPLQCGCVLYDKTFNTDLDFTISFSYIFDTSSGTSSQNNGFTVFFLSGGAVSLAGGGCGEGLGVVSSTDTTSTSSINGIFYTVAFDNIGDFFLINSIPPFITGTAVQIPRSIGLRTTTDFTYITSVSCSYHSFFNDNTTNTVRVRLRKKTSELLVDALDGNNVYQNLLTCNTLLSNIPQTAKFGISYSGDTIFKVKDITLNYTV